MCVCVYNLFKGLILVHMSHVLCVVRVVCHTCMGVYKNMYLCLRMYMCMTVCIFR